MFGVVLWSDRQKNCAVIWCEDHRHLAYFKDDAEAAPRRVLGTGDLVEFELHEDNDIRFALDPNVIAEKQYAWLADDLIRGGRANQPYPPDPISLPGQEAGGSKVLTFPKCACAVSAPAQRLSHCGC